MNRQLKKIYLDHVINILNKEPLNWAYKNEFNRYESSEYYLYKTDDIRIEISLTDKKIYTVLINDGNKIINIPMYIDFIFNFKFIFSFKKMKKILKNKSIDDEINSFLKYTEYDRKFLK